MPIKYLELFVSLYLNTYSVATTDVKIAVGS
jgi:hypothetical protein